MPVKTRHQYKRESIKNERRRNPVRTRSREEALERANVERQKSLVVKRLKPEVVRDKAVVCVKPVREIKLKLHQRKLKHLCGTSRPEHPAYTRCPRCGDLQRLHVLKNGANVVVKYTVLT